MWGSWLNGFRAFLKLEKSLSQNSIEAYCRDLKKLESFLEKSLVNITPLQVHPQPTSSGHSPFPRGHYKGHPIATMPMLSGRRRDLSSFSSLHGQPFFCD